MKTLKLFLFIIQSIFLGLLVAAAYVLWQADFDPAKIAEYMPTGQDKVQTAPQRILTKGPVSYADAVKSSSASVVTIYTSKKIRPKIHPLLEDPVIGQLFGEQIKKLKREKTETNLGSGVIMTHSGYILTNQHVIDGADEILISLADGRSSEASLIGQDRESDIAVLHTPLDALTSIQIANNKDKLQVGDIALAIGNPLNVGQTVTMGIVSATGRNRVGLNTFENFIQTDAAINPGNSGGALINANGDLIGINTAIFSQSGGSQGIGFAIPATLAVDIMQEIIATGKVTRGWLGVEGTEITAKAAMASGNPNIRGVLIVGVFIDSPADIAGVQTGDIIIAINNQQVFRVRNVLENIAGHKPGDRIIISLLRNGNPMELELVATERPQ